MKYVIVLGDGMADEPIEALGGKTPLEYANTPVMDELASGGEMGMTQNVPAGMHPGSEVANLAVVGYDPEVYFTGRSPMEALSVGVQMEDSDIIFRANVVTLSEEEPYDQKTLIDHSASEIETADTDILMDAIREAFNSEEIQFYTGTSYRNICVWKGGHIVDIDPPHDHLGQKVTELLPTEKLFRDMMEKSFDILNNHPLNIERAKKGLNKANSLWFWGAGTKPSFDGFEKRTGMKGAMVSAVDLLKGIAVGDGLLVKEVEGATGSLHTNYEGKASAAVKALLEDGQDFVYVHVEAPDEMGHQGSVERKIQAIEYLDERIIRYVKEAMDASGEDYRMMILPDHPTPIEVRTHTSEPVPYLLYDSTKPQENSWKYSEKCAAAGGIYHAAGHELIDYLFRD
jgi:2,3-bisphosphoglycerate-independent phosphoglycerate mutase